MQDKIIHGILNADGTLQIDSNDRGLRIILSSVKNIEDGRVVEAFKSSYYVNEGFGWERTLETHKYHSVEEFLKAINNSSDFTEAVKDIQQQREDLRLAGSRNV